MREYRGKRIDNGEWVYGSLLETNKASYIVPTGTKEVSINGKRHIHWDDLIEVDPDTVGKSTGITDQEGRTYYDGDIFNIGDQRYIVVFEDGAFWSKWLINGSRSLLYGHGHSGLVIGNRWDHPYLLGEDSK